MSTTYQYHGRLQGSFAGTLTFDSLPPLVSPPSDNAMFIAKLTPETVGVWSRSYTGAAGKSETGQSIAVNPITKGCFTTGTYEGFLTVGPFNLTAPNTIDWFDDQVFVIASDADGNPVYARGYYTVGQEVNSGGVGVDLRGNAYVSAAYRNNVVIGPEVGTLTAMQEVGTSCCSSSRGYPSRGLWR